MHLGKGTMAMVVVVLRSVVISGALLLALPMILYIMGVWLAMPITELIVAANALIDVKKVDISTECE